MRRRGSATPDPRIDGPRGQLWHSGREQKCYEALVFDTASWPAMTQRYHEAFLIGEQPQLGSVGKRSAPRWPASVTESQVVFLRPMGRRHQLNGELLDPERTQPFTPGPPCATRARPPAFRGHPALLHGGREHPGVSAGGSRGQPLVQIPRPTSPSSVQCESRSGMLVGVMAPADRASRLTCWRARPPTFGESCSMDGQSPPANRSRIGSSHRPITCSRN